VGGKTISEKILSRAGRTDVRAGQIIYPEPDLVVIHDWYSAHAIATLERFGVDRLHAPEKVLFVTDHEPLAVSEQAAIRQATVRQAVTRLSITGFFDVGRGGHGHVFPVEMGYVRPGMYVAGYDTHVPNYGAVGALAIAFLTEIVEVLALGSVWVRVPESIRINIVGRLCEWVSVRDFAQRLIGDLDAEVVDYTVVEFAGEGLANLPFDSRFTLCNTPIELGAKSAIVQPDAATTSYLREKGIEVEEQVISDNDAKYVLSVNYDLGQITPQIAVPPVPDQVVPVAELAGTKIQHAFIGSCASGLLSDLRMAAAILRNRRVHRNVRLFITPASYEILALATREGLVNIFVEAGAILTAPGCGPCALGRIGPIAPGESSINTGTRNDFGRLGPREGNIYLAAPTTVAAAAVAGQIVDPRDLMADASVV